MTLCITLLLLASQAPPAFGSDRFHELTIREIYAAGHPQPNWETHFFFANPLGDHDRDGQMDFALSGVGLKPRYYGDELIRLESGLRARHEERYHSLYWSKFHPQQSTAAEGYGLALLSTPAGPRVAILNTQAELTLWEVETRAFLGIVPVPPPPVPGLPGADVLTFVTGDSDVDADGWSDLYFMDRNGGYGIVGLISGRTLQPMWQHLEPPPANVSLPNPHLGTSKRPDFDHDSVVDFLFAFEQWRGGYSEYHLGVLSGATGALLWEQNLVTSTSGWATPVPDVTHDGVSDVVMGVGHRVLDSEVLVQGLDGATGALIWTRTKAEVVARIPPYFATLLPDPAGWCQPSPFPHLGDRHEVWTHFQIDDGNPWTSTPRNAFVVLDPRNGSVLDTIIQPRELHPWRHYSSSGGTNQRNVFPLGDVDRDGLIEYAQPVAANDVNDPNIPGDPYHLVIYGQNTLLGPAEAGPGESLPLELWIPSTPGHEAWIVASTVLEGEAGLELDGWRTRLGASALRSLTVLTQPGRATLDAHGRASLTMRLPDWPRLVGEQVFLRAIVEQPVTGEIWTMSSLAVVSLR